MPVRGQERAQALVQVLQAGLVSERVLPPLAEPRLVRALRAGETLPLDLVPGQEAVFPMQAGP